MIKDFVLPIGWIESSHNYFENDYYVVNIRPLDNMFKIWAGKKDKSETFMNKICGSKKESLEEANDFMEKNTVKFL